MMLKAKSNTLKKAWFHPIKASLSQMHDKLVSEKMVFNKTPWVKLVINATYIRNW